MNQNFQWSYQILDLLDCQSIHNHYVTYYDPLWDTSWHSALYIGLQDRQLVPDY